MLRTFQGNPVVLPLPACGRLHFLILLVHQEVFHRQGAGFPHRALGSRQEDVGLPRGAEGAAALLVAEGRARLLQVLAVGGAHLQLPSEVLVHPLAKPVARRAAPAVAADEGPAGRRRVAGVGGIGAPGQEVGIGGCPLDAAVGELAPLACVHVLRARETRREAKSHTALWRHKQNLKFTGHNTLLHTGGASQLSPHDQHLEEKLQWADLRAQPKEDQTQRRDGRERLLGLGVSKHTTQSHLFTSG